MVVYTLCAGRDYLMDHRGTLNMNPLLRTDQEALHGDKADRRRINQLSARAGHN